MTQITVVLQNLQHGGQDRWPLLRERFRAARPGILLLNEALGWLANDEAFLRQAEDDLGMTALRPLPPARSGHHVAILYSPDMLPAPVDYNIDFAAQFEHGVGVAAWDVGLDSPFGVAVTHVTPFSPTEALIEAEKARWTALRYGRYGSIFADFNGPPLFGPAADVSRMLARDRASRFRDFGCTIPNTDVAEAFRKAGFIDTAEILYTRDKDERHLARTGRSDRIDWGLVTEEVRDAVIGGELLDVPSGAADHRGLLRIFDFALIDTGATASGS